MNNDFTKQQVEEALKLAIQFVREQEGVSPSWFGFYRASKFKEAYECLKWYEENPS